MARMLQATVRAIRRRAGVFVLVVAAIAALHLVLPPLVLSVARKPYDYFSINPWLPNLPSWLASREANASRKADFLRNAAGLGVVASGGVGGRGGGVSRLDRARGLRRERGRAGQAGD